MTNMTDIMIVTYRHSRDRNNMRRPLNHSQTAVFDYINVLIVFMKVESLHKRPVFTLKYSATENTSTHFAYFINNKI